MIVIPFSTRNPSARQTAEARALLATLQLLPDNLVSQMLRRGLSRRLPLQRLYELAVGWLERHPAAGRPLPPPWPSSWPPRPTAIAASMPPSTS